MALRLAFLSLFAFCLVAEGAFLQRAVPTAGSVSGTANSSVGYLLPPGFLKRGGVILDFEGATVTQNNLGGFGPDSGDECLYFSQIANFSNRILDLKIMAVSGYKPNDVTNNGKSTDHFAQINVKKNKQALLNFTLLDHTTGEPVFVPLVAITIWDFDMGNKPGRLVETATVKPMVGYYMVPDSVIDMQNLGNNTYEFSATTYGTEADNPVNPFNVTSAQMRKAVGIEFANLSTWNITFGVTKDGNGGRNFLFGGIVPRLPYVPGPCENFTDVSFATATVLYSNLAGLGPDTGSPVGIKYGNVAVVNGTSIDLKVRTEQIYGDYAAHDITKNGLYGKLANVNLQAGVQVRLNFTFMIGGTPVALERFFISVLDIDMTGKGAAEVLTVNNTKGDPLHGYAYYFVEQANSLTIAPMGTKTSFTGAKAGVGATNPTDPRALTTAQAKRVVTFFFKNPTSTFVLDYSAHPASWTGRNVLIGGVTNTACPDTHT